MLPLSAIDAIGPAWSHTRRLLWENRSWRTILKIGVVACFAGIGGIGSGGGGNFNNFGNFGNSGHPANMPSNWPASAASILAAVAAVAVFFFIAFFIVFAIMIYISSRLKFVLFEVVLRSDTTVGPIWRRYGAATWRWVGLKLILLTAALLCMAPILVPAIVQFIHVLSQQGSQPGNVGLLFATFFGFFAMALLVALIFGIVNILLHDFALPSMALESTSIGESVSRVWRLVRAEPGQVALFFLMRLIFGIAGAWCANIVILIGALIAMIPFGIVGVLDYAVLHSAGTPGKVMMIVIWVLLAVLFVALIFIASFMLLGYLVTFIQAYALYFLGGRYPLMGQYLAPYWPQSHRIIPVPPAYQPPPTPPAPPAFEPPPAV